MNLEELKQKKDYLHSLRDFTSEELAFIHDEVIRLNVKPNARKEEISGIIRVYSDIDYIRAEESSFPYPKGYTYPLSEEFLQNLNRAILQDYSGFLPCEKGFYRRGTATINDEVLPSIDVFRPRLKELIGNYNVTDDNMISWLAFFHLEFLTKIHPFCDGNGRTLRAFMNLELARRGYPMIGLKYSNIDAYNDAFDIYIHSDDSMPMEELITKCLSDELDKQISRKRG